MRQIINHFTDDDLYKFSMCCAVIDNYPRAMVKYQFVDRNNTVYPEGFADELNRQIESLESLQITDEEINFLKHRCYYISNWFYPYLKGFKFDKKSICARCKLVNLCPTCYACNKAATGDIGKMDSDMCLLNRLCILAGAKIEYYRLIDNDSNSVETQRTLKAIEVLQTETFNPASVYLNNPYFFERALMPLVATT